jgi:capsular polysaccharide biosynthesis protein
VPDEPVSPNPVRNGILALALGLMLGVGLAFLLEYLDDSWRSPEEVEHITGVPTFGTIPEYKALSGSEVFKGQKGAS